MTLEAPAAPRRRRLALWLGGIAIASVVGIAAGLSLHRPGGDRAAGGNGAAASTAPDRAATSSAPDRAAAALPVDAGAGPTPADARVAVAALPVADPPPDAAVAVAPAHPPPPAPRPLPAAPPRNPAAEEHLRAAEDALQANHVLKQFAEADLALRANPRSVRARYLVGDALIKSGDLDRGCSYLAQLKHLTIARSRARAAGCPSD